MAGSRPGPQPTSKTTEADGGAKRSELGQCPPPGRFGLHGEEIGEVAQFDPTILAKVIPFGLLAQFACVKVHTEGISSSQFSYG